MALDATHPDYAKRTGQWSKMRDFYEGEEQVKARGEIYLPPTQSMVLDGMKKPDELGSVAYRSYLMRTVFPDYTKDAVEAYIGLLHQKPATIELPAAMEPLRLKATANGESLDLLLRRINEEQLVTGRGGLLADLPRKPDPANPIPYIAIYSAESIRNWDDGSIEEGESQLNLVVLDESGITRDADFDWTTVVKYRVLQLGLLDENEAEGDAIYHVGVFEEAGTGVPTFVPSDMKTPMIRGKTLSKIPFSFFNSKDIVATPDAPPLMGLGRACLAIYRGEADYRQNLFMQGQDTFVVVGEMKRTSVDLNQEDGKGPVRTGAGSMLHLDIGGSAEYVGVGGEGLAEQRESLENDRKRAETKSGQLIDSNGSGNVESGEALKTRVAAQTATLHQIANTGAASLEYVLKAIAEWMGANPDEVKVTPNLEFADYEMTGKNLVDLMTARQLGAPISRKSVHALMVDKGLTKMDYETEVDLIDEENLSEGMTDALKPGSAAPGTGGVEIREDPASGPDAE